MRWTIAVTLLVSGVVFAGGAIAAAGAMRRGGMARGMPAFIAYFGMAFACIGEAGWLLSGRVL